MLSAPEKAPVVAESAWHVTPCKVDAPDTVSPGRVSAPVELMGPDSLIELAVNWIAPLPDDRLRPASFKNTVGFPDAVDISGFDSTAENFLNSLASLLVLGEGSRNTKSGTMFRVVASHILNSPSIYLSMAWESDILPALDQGILLEGFDSCEEAVQKWQEACSRSDLMMVHDYADDGDKRECVWFCGGGGKGPYDGFWLAWAGDVPAKPCSREWLRTLLLGIRRFDRLEDLFFDRPTTTAQKALLDFKKKWPMKYGMDYHHPWLLSFCKSIGRLPVTEAKAYPDGWQTQYGTELDAARTLSRELVDDKDILSRAVEYALQCQSR